MIAGFRSPSRSRPGRPEAEKAGSGDGARTREAVPRAPGRKIEKIGEVGHCNCEADRTTNGSLEIVALVTERYEKRRARAVQHAAASWPDAFLEAGGLRTTLRRTATD